MQYLCLILVISGALIMTWSIWQYYLVLNYMKKQTYEQKIFQNWIYGASFMMMIFFLVGYIIFAVMLAISPFHSESLLVALIFFFGAIFVLFMVNVQKTMSKTITGKLLETIQSMVDAMEAKDFYTKGHSEHVLKLAELLYRHLPDNVKLKIDITKLKDAAMLHDIGKIGIPDGILNKPGKLSDEEYTVIQQHPKNSKNILEKTAYRDISDMVLYHHERVDGNGYYKIPLNTIPLESKIIAVADTFSALYTDRIYRKKLPLDKALSSLKDAAGTQLDSTIVDIFCAIPEKELNDASVSTI
jgi:HD-GYP domain-containing protein (c-di-GMP phosphodiesterase class II)